MKYFYFILCSFLSLAQAIEVNSNQSELVKSPKIKYEFTYATAIKGLTISRSKKFEWMRYKKKITYPRLFIRINLANDKNYHFEYQKEKFYTQKNKTQKFSSFFISPYLEKYISVYEGERFISKIDLDFKRLSKDELVDKSCADVKLKVQNPESTQLILGCEYILGTKDKRELKLYSLTNKSDGLRSSFISSNSQIEVSKDSELKVEAKYTKRKKKFSLAFGLGPYVFETKLGVKEKNVLSTALMLYSNYKINNETSIRAFNASIFKESQFHNLGLYLANDFAHLDDDDLIFTSLLGVQYLDFKFESGSKKFSDPLYPQGIEFTYRRLFKNKNYIVSGGIFLNPSSDDGYQNAWVRWGEKYYYELNYINWSSDDFKATMWGLSLIFPLGKFF